MTTVEARLSRFPIVSDLDRPSPKEESDGEAPTTFPSRLSIAGFLLRQVFMTIPREFDEAAEVDGASPLRFLV